MPQSTFHNSFSPLLNPQSYKGLGMSQSTNAQEANSNSEVSPQPNRNKRAGTPARSTRTPPTAASGKGHENGKSHGNRSSVRSSASLNATRPAPPGKGKATQGAATVTSSKGPGNGSNAQPTASPHATRPAPPGKGKATRGAATSGRSGSENGSNTQHSASPDATPPVSRTKRKGRKAKQPVAAASSGVNGSGKGSNNQVVGEVTVASDEIVEEWWPVRQFISPLNGDNDVYLERMVEWEQRWESEDRAQAIAYLYEIRPERLSLSNDYVEQERGLWKAP
ncbi:hypothetical protein DFP72DRAFT_1165782 [Ephemerocybe angulata]|uniref:Uncharacterized protein n=1 Tax=Ephemerocybe angulata TaxID=980116 RepID=A0A8H6IBI6_9AGAR|nr:hypothetical protein DFP72DRAFT_1165782 [Tulosesus angulatus]